MFVPLTSCQLTPLELFEFGRELRAKHDFTPRIATTRNALRESYQVELHQTGATQKGFLIRRGYEPKIEVNGFDREMMDRTEERSFYAIIHSMLHADGNAPFQVLAEDSKDPVYGACYQQARWAMVGLCVPPEVVKELLYPIGTEEFSERRSNEVNAGVSHFLMQAAATFYRHYPDLLEEPATEGPSL